MTVLKSIVIAMFVFQLSLLVVNNVFIGDANVRMTTGQITNSQATIPMDLLNQTVGNLKASLTNAGYTNQSIRFCSMQNNVLGIGWFINDFVQATLRIAYANSGDLVPKEITNFFVLIVSLITLVLVLLITFLALIYNSTIGAVFLYSSMFGLIDPVLGGILGTVLGTIQALLIVWGLSEFLPIPGGKKEA